MDIVDMLGGILGSVESPYPSLLQQQQYSAGYKTFLGYVPNNIPISPPIGMQCATLQPKKFSSYKEELQDEINGWIKDVFN